MNKTRFWVSWYDAEPDYRPLHDPPHETILGWWWTGETCDEPPKATLVAWIEATSEHSARRVLEEEWPETEGAEFRFFDMVDEAWRPTKRFPLSKWMKERIA